jgi:hypothetical protein
MDRLPVNNRGQQYYSRSGLSGTVSHVTPLRGVVIALVI